MDNKFYQIFNKIDYDTYQIIKNSCAKTGIWALLSNISVKQNPILDNCFKIIFAISSVAYFGLTLSNGELYTKDVNEIRVLYQQFIKNYNKMNKDFELTNPIQIYTMFNYLLYRGYLSKDKEFQFNNEDPRIIISMLGSNIITGKGVCRHIASMLKDILNDYGIESYNLCCCSKPCEIMANITEQQELFYEEQRLQQHIIDAETNQRVNAVLEEMEKKEREMELSHKQDFIKKIIGTHLICFSRYNGENYYLDPTKSIIYRLTPNSNILYGNEEDKKLEITQMSSMIFNNLIGYIKMRWRLLNSNSNVPLEEEQELVLTTNNLCKQNMDIFEKFYNDNSEIYDEISNRLIKFRENQYANKER